MNVHMIGSLGILDCCILRETMLGNTILYLESRSEKVLVEVIRLSLVRSQNRRVFRACISAALDFLLPYCSGVRALISSAVFIVSFPRCFVCRLSSTTKIRMGLRR